MYLAVHPPAASTSGGTSAGCGLPPPVPAQEPRPVPGRRLARRPKIDRSVCELIGPVPGVGNGVAGSWGLGEYRFYWTVGSARLASSSWY